MPQFYVEKNGRCSFHPLLFFNFDKYLLIRVTNVLTRLLFLLQVSRESCPLRGFFVRGL